MTRPFTIFPVIKSQDPYKRLLYLIQRMKEGKQYTQLSPPTKLVTAPTAATGEPSDVGTLPGGATGFLNRDDSTVTFTNGTRRFVIIPTGFETDFNYYIGGVEFTTTGDDIFITDVEGLHYIYYDGDVLTEAVNPDFTSIQTVIKDYALVAIIYWDATNNLGIYVGEERHGVWMSGAVHSNLHFTHGLQWLSGLGLNSIDADQSGANNSHAQFAVTLGIVEDEDLNFDIAAVDSDAGLNIYYLHDIAGDVRLTTQADFACKTTGTGRLGYNRNRLGIWDITEVSNNGFVLYHVFATTEKDNPMISIMGQAEYGNKKAAQTGALSEINDLILGNMPTPEYRPIATVIFQTSNAYGNAVKARIVTTDDGDDYIDWRTTEVIRGTSLIAFSLDHTGISANDVDTDVTGAELEELTDGSTTTKHKHAERLYVAFTQELRANTTWALMDGIITCSNIFGWIPMRDCSITGMSCQANQLGAPGSEWDIQVWVNGFLVWSDTLSTAGDHSICFQTRAAGEIPVLAGQNISVLFALVAGAESIRDPHVLVEITYD